MQRARKAWNTADIVEFSILFIHTLSIWRDISLSMIVFVFDTFGEESFYLFSFTIWSFWILPHIFHFHVWVVLVTHFSPRGFTAIFTSFASCFRLSTNQFLFRASISTQRTCLWLTGLRGFSPITTMLVKPGRWDGWLKNKVEPRRVKFSKKTCLSGKIFMFFLSDPSPIIGNACQ